MGLRQKGFILVALAIASATALSSIRHHESQQDPYPQPFAGQFIYAGELIPVLKISSERVVAISDAGKMRLKELKKQKYHCAYLQSSTYRCLQQLRLTVVEDWVRPAVENQMVTPFVRFLGGDGPIEEESVGEEFKSWYVYQAVETNQEIFQRYLWTWTPTVSKVLLKKRLSNETYQYLNIESSNELSQQITVTRTLDKNRYERHIVKAKFLLQN